MKHGESRIIHFGGYAQSFKTLCIEIAVKNNASSLVRGSETALRQIMVNLISNAVKYNRKDGKVRIHLDDSGGRVAISIQDEGLGISNVESDRIFEKFYRASGSERIKGAGLGLYIVRLLIEAMGGDITVVSQPGTGSTFTVSFIKVDVAALYSGQGLA